VTTDEPTDQLRQIAERVVRSHGLELFDLQLRRESIGWVLRVTIDRPVFVDEQGVVVVERPEDAIGIEECQRVSTDLGTVLDVEDVVDVPYTLEVSSPGLDRPLRDERDYRRFAGRVAKIVVREALDGQVHFEGRLQGVDGDAVVLEVARGRVKRIPLERVSRAKLAVEF
jgi:ribosome maturation factor RimP